MYKPLYIADMQSGLIRNKESYLIPQDAFPEITNAYLFRGRIKRRLGFEFLGRLQRNLEDDSLGNTGASPWSFNIYTLLTITGEPNAEIVPGTVSIDLNTGVEIFTEPVVPDGTLVSNLGGTGTINYFTGDVTLTHSQGAGVPALITFSYYPSLPVMDLSVREIITNNNENLIAFDTKYSYLFNTASDQFEEWIPGTTWNGTNSDFFWTTNYWQSGANIGLFWATNFNTSITPDPIRYTDGVTWTNFLPAINGAGDELHQCLALIPFKDRLLAFNTFEGATLAASIQFPQRLRFSQNGDPLQVDAWRQDIPGKGGFIDAPTNEHIIAVGFVRDVLVVGFERSTWQVRYTGNEILPFVWERINSDYGIESTYSLIQFDNTILGVGSNAIQICDGNTSQRIDLQIPDEVFKFHNANQGINRVHGVRDFFNELVYWTFPNDAENGTFPNRVLVYNYRNQSYSFFRDSFTCYSYWQRTNDRRWQDYVNTPEDFWVNQQYTWASPLNQSLFPNVVAGNQQGYVLVVQQINANSPSLTIQAITAATPGVFTSPNHNLQNGDIIRLNGIIGTIASQFGTLNNRTYKVFNVTTNTFSLLALENGVFQQIVTTGTYIVGGEIQIINVIDVRSKKFNALEIGQSIKLGYVDFLAEVTSSGEFTFNIYADYNNENPINDGSDQFFNNRVLTSIEQFQTTGQTLSWHRSFCPERCQFYQFQITQNDTQLFDYTIASSNLIIHALILWFEEGGRLI